jgi:hypothetical protein
MHYLDFKRDADPPTGSIPVDTEREFLRLALSQGPLLIRGKSLCDWAETFWTERGIPYITCASLSDELGACCGALTPELTATLLENHGEAFRSIERPLSLITVLDALFQTDIWHQPTSLQHAARWLLWLHTANPGDYLTPLLRAQTGLWWQAAEESIKPVYQTVLPQEAHVFLRRWLRIAPPYLALPSKPFPLDVSAALKAEALQEWRLKTINTKGAFFEDLAREPIPPELLSLAADLCFEYFIHNPHLLTEANLRRLRAYLPDQKTEALRKLLRPSAPLPIPQEVPQVFSWFLESYLPYREWAILVASQADISRTSEIAKAFAIAFLDRYPQFVMGQHAVISFQKAGQLRERNGTEVTIYAILDGLNVPDSLILLKHIASRTSRLTILQNDLCFAPVPTITEVCKQALKRGYTPRIAAADHNQDPPHVKLLPEKKDPDALLLNAQPGDLFIWSIMEPDETYHSKGYDRQTLKKVVADRLESVADRMINAVFAIPDDKKVRLVITTDHGRLLNSSERHIVAPSGMHPHQRAAVGRASVVFPPTGLLVQEQEGIAFLNSDRFHLPDDSAIILGEGSFFMEDGKSGIELFPHGGASPEEVIIPWIELAKDAELPTVVCTISGEAQEATQGIVHIAIQNPSNMTLRAQFITLTLSPSRKLQLSIERPLTPWSTLALDSPLTPWPSEIEARRASTQLQLVKPNGDQFVITPTLTLKVHGFQSRTDILDDLL